MACPKCGAANPEAKKFCTGCGAALAVTCAACGGENPPGAKFCGDCGASLSADAQPLDTESEPVPAAGERRQVAILFADISGYTKLSSELDPEETHDLLSRFFDAVDGVVTSFGGRVDKHIGDNVMAVFGAPVAHGNDPERSVRAALEIHQAMPGLSEALGRPIRVHVGIASGEVVASGLGSASHQEYTVTGDSVNLASRLGDMAGPGETLISDAVYIAAANLLECDEVDNVTVEGLDEPVRIWRLRALSAGEGRGLPFVGRQAELRLLTGAIEACREAGSGQAILVRGEAGIGKTRLIQEFRAIAEGRGFACHTGLVLDFGMGKGQEAIPALVRSLIGIPPGSGKPARQAAADKVLANGLLQADQRVFLNDLLDLAQPPEMLAMYDAMDHATRGLGQQETVAELVKGVSARQPVLVTVENIHWADTITLAHLAAMTRVVATCPAILVMTSRAEGDPLDQVWRSTIRASPLMTIDLAPLREDEAVALAGRFIDATSRFAMKCIARAEGNPLFLEQLLRSAEETAEDRIPGSIQSLVLARMDTLDAPEKQALQAASVIGQQFSLDLLRHLIESRQFTCAGLIEHYLVRPDGEDYLFAHALIQEGVYSSLLKAKRRELHGRAAQWFAERDPVLKARHLDRAGDPAAVRAYGEAARAQADQYRYERALELIERGLAAAGAAGERYELLALEGEYLRESGRPADSIAAYRQALEATDSEQDKCRAWIGLAAGMRVVDRYDEALEVLDKAETAATRHGLVGDLAQIHYYRGNLYFALVNIDGCLEQHERALEYGREAGSPEVEARALSGLGDAYYQRGRIIAAHDHFHRCIELCRQHGFGRIEVANLHMRGWTHYYQNDLEAALDDCRAGAAAAAKVGHHRAEMTARGTTGYILASATEWAGAKEQIELCLALARRLGARRFEALYCLPLGRILTADGHRREALKLVGESVAVIRESGMTFSGPLALGALALVSDDPEQRRRALDEGAEILRQDCVSHNYFWFYRDAMEASLEGADWEGVERYATALEDYTRPEPLPWTDLFIARGRALADYGRGKRDDTTIQELKRLRDEAERVGLKSAVPALDRALAGM